jgi:hypothetical protein
MKPHCTQNTDRECKNEDCCLKKNKIRLIPFDYDKAKNGAKLIYRNGNYPTEVFFPWTAGHSTTCVASVYLGQIYTHFKDGYCNIQRSECELDLFIEEEIQEKTFYVNVYEECIGASTHDTIEEARDRGKRNLGSKGILKIIYTDEDLIK